MLNNVILIGNIGFVKRGFIDKTTIPYTIITLATDSYYIKDGVKQHSVIWHNVRFKGDIANNFDKLGLDKGDRIFVEGSISYYKKEDRLYTSIEAFRFLIVNRSSGQDAHDLDYNKQNDDVPYYNKQNDDVPF